MRLAVLGCGMVLVLGAAGCGGERPREAATTAAPVPAKPVPVQPHCSVTQERELTSARVSYAGFARNGAVAYRTPGGKVVARFGRENVNHYPTYFGVLGKRVGMDCRALWYRVQLPIRPNGAIGWVRASSLELQPIDLRIEVDVSSRQLMLFRAGRRVLKATVAVGSQATPTPIGRYYVNQILVPTNTSGPFGPAALGISAFSPVLTGWAQGGPVAIHGTNEPWSIGHAVSNGCIRLPNDTLTRLFKIVPPGTQVIIHP
ncbi:MAG: L,D-transpeptidase, partial [Gaiellaceae bacterium]